MDMDMDYEFPDGSYIALCWSSGSIAITGKPTGRTADLRSVSIRLCFIFNSDKQCIWIP